MDPKKLESAFQEIVDGNMSPFCPGRTISGCPSEDARALRDEIREWLRDGRTGEEIEATLVALYGESVRGAPGGEGFDVVAWALPGAVMILGAFLILRVVRKFEGLKKAKSNGKMPAQEKSITSKYTKQVEAELKKRMS